MNTGVASLWTASNLVWVQTAAESVLFPKSESAAAARHSPRGRGSWRAVCLSSHSAVEEFTFISCCASFSSKDTVAA